MATSDGRREVLDSEDEFMTSSPADVIKFDADKLSPTGPVPPQGRQDALLEANVSHQAPAKQIANTASDFAESLVADRRNASIDVGGRSADKPETHNDVPVRQQGCVHAADDGGAHAKTMRAVSPPEPVNTVVAHPSIAKEEDLASHGSHLGSATSFCVRDEVNAGIVNESNLDEDQANPSEPVMHSFADAAHSGRPMVADQMRTIGATAHMTYSESHEQQRSPEEGSSIIAQCAADNTPTRDLLHEQGKEVDQVERLIHDELAVVPLSQGAVTVEHASSATVNKSGDDRERLPGDTVSQTPHATAPSAEMHRLKPGSESSKLPPGGDRSLTKPEAPRPETILRSQSSKEEHIQGQGTENNSAIERKAIHTRSGDDTDQVMPSPTSAASTSQSLLALAAPETHCTAHAPPPQTPQEITLAELKAQKAALLTSLASLPAIQVLIEEGAGPEAEVDDKLEGATEADVMIAANKIVKEHIKLLHEYNELKDVGQGLMGLIADQRGVRIVEVQDEFGIEAKD